MKILIVDDEALVRRTLSRLLKAKKYEVFEAADGHQGFQMWKEHQPDLTFLDILMPGLSGPQVLKNLGELRSGRVILMSAFAGEHNMETALEMGADLFIGKPFEDIFSVIKIAEDLLK
jgi:CheY-like chemotaxis protein